MLRPRLRKTPHRLVSFLIIGLIAGLIGPVSLSTAASGTDSPEVIGATGGQRMQSERPKAIPCEKNTGTVDGGITGFASAAGKRIVGAKVRVYVQGKSDRVGAFTRELRTFGMSRTNRLGGFALSVGCLPQTFKVKVSGGRIDGVKFKDSISALGDAADIGVIVTPATSIAVAYMERKGVSASSAVQQTSRHLRIVKLGTKVINLGSATWVKSKTFDPKKFMQVARNKGGIEKFVKQEARRISDTSRRGFRPDKYKLRGPTGYNNAGYNGTPRVRTSATPVVRSAQASSATDLAFDVLGAVAGKAAFNVSCAVLPPSPPTNMACADPDANQLNEISNQLTAISNQLTALQSSVNDIIAMLNSMQTQLNQMESQLNTIIQQNSIEQQETLQVQAQNAQQAYQAAYSFAGIAQVSALVQAASTDMTVLGAIEPSSSPTWPIVPSGSTNDSMCLTMYSKYNTSSGQNPMSVCADFLTQVQAFANPTTAYYSVMYKSLTGAGGIPQNDLLIWTMQEMLNFASNAPVSAQTLINMHDTIGQIAALSSNAFALLAAGQMFEYAATTGEYTTCPNLTTKGTFPANTPITVSDACDTLQTALFTSAVETEQSFDVSMPPTGSVADPRTNYIWWGYPLDVSAGTTTADSYPFYPGAPAGTYNTTPHGPILAWYNLKHSASTGGIDPTEIWKPRDHLVMAFYTYYSVMSPKVNSYTADFPPPPPMLKKNRRYEFLFAQWDTASTLFGNLLLTNPSSVAATMNQQGFVGIGQSGNGMKWNNAGFNVAYYSEIPVQYAWQTTTPTSGCGTFPPAPSGNTFNWLCLGGGYAELYGVWANESVSVTTTTNPTLNGPAACNFISESYFRMCPVGTFGLMVDKSAPRPNNPDQVRRFLPPFWEVSMLDGPPSSGVRAIPISVKPVTAPTT